MGLWPPEIKSSASHCLAGKCIVVLDTALRVLVIRNRHKLKWTACLGAYLSLLSLQITAISGRSCVFFMGMARTWDRIE
jgi:hypothetical protein